jgi:hypothetical protein
MGATVAMGPRLRGCGGVRGCDECSGRARFDGCRSVAVIAEIADIAMVAVLAMVAAWPRGEPVTTYARSLVDVAGERPPGGSRISRQPALYPAAQTRISRQPALSPASPCYPPPHADRRAMPTADRRTPHATRCRTPHTAHRPQPGCPPAATGRPGVFDHCDHEPGYTAGVNPASVSASASCAAVTPDPQ